MADDIVTGTQSLDNGRVTPTTPTNPNPFDGPWEAAHAYEPGTGRDCIRISTSSDGTVAHIRLNDPAYARLIAAAPDLLAACEEMLPAWQEMATASKGMVGEWARQVADDAAATIAKAKGEDA